MPCTNTQNNIPINNPYNLLDKVDFNNPYSVRMTNDRIMQIERTFIVSMPEDWPDKKANRLIQKK